MNFKILAPAAALLTGICSVPALAATLYGAIGDGDTGGGSTLVQIDPATGAVLDTIGSVGFLVNGMAWVGAESTLYASTSGNDATCPRGLITIDLTTGSGTVIGCGASSGQAPALLTANSSGQLYSWLEPSSDDLILWDKNAGTYSAPIGESGLNTGRHTLSFDNSDVLYLLNYDNAAYTIDTTTGDSTYLDDVPFPDEAHHGDFNPDDGLLYAIDAGGGSNPRNIVVLNTTLLSVQATLPTADNLHVLAFAGEALPPPASSETPVPTLSQWAMLVLASILGIAGFFGLRRRLS